MSKKHDLDSIGKPENALSKKRIDFLKHRNRILTLLILLGTLLAAAIALGIVISRHVANDPYCTSIDPTGCTVEVKIYNDTNNPLAIEQCENGNIPCKSFAVTTTLQPGQTSSANGSTDDTPQPWEVLNLQGTVIGCLNLEFTKLQNPPITTPLSKMLPCSQVNDAIAAFKKQNVVF